MALAAPVAAQEEAHAPFVTQVRVPARGAALDVFAWRSPEGVLIERSALEALGFAVADDAGGDLVPLAAIPGLAYDEDAASASIVIDGHVVAARCATSPRNVALAHGVRAVARGTCNANGHAAAGAS